MPSRDGAALSRAEQDALLRIARESIADGLRTGRPLRVDPGAVPPALHEPRASFVTLRRGGALRGCIGELAPSRPLAEGVAHHAFAAAFRDPRFPPLAAEEVADLDVHLSILGPLEPFAAATEADLLAQLRPGVDGLVIEQGPRRATFLPAVWESLHEPREFLRALKQKAGLPPDEWSPEIRAYRYRVEEVPGA